MAEPKLPPPPETTDLTSLRPTSSRLTGIDAFRGFVMLAMASAGLGIPQVAKHFPADSPWQSIAHQLEHVAWRGGVFWDMIQPSFMFLVGVALPFSYRSRQSQGQSWGRMFAHALWRSIVLVALGVFLSSTGSKQTHFTFANVLCQIGLGYMVIFLLVRCSPRTQLIAALAILAADWLLFVVYPLPGTGIDRQSLSVPSDWTPLTGFLAHWDKNTNVAAAFDRWFLNLFPRPGGKPFVFNEGGYATLNFIPSIATMIFGLMAGELLRSDRSGLAKIRVLAAAAAIGVLAAMALDLTICPIVKRIWTPTWTLYSTGLTCGMLVFFYGATDLIGFRRWAYPLVVVGANSIAMYVMAQLLKPFVASSLKIHLGVPWKALAANPSVDRFAADRFGFHLAPTLFGGPYGPIAQSASVLLVLWLVCWWMYRRNIFLKV